MISFRALLPIFVILSHTAIAQAPSREHIDFDANWKFHLGHAANAEKDFNYSIATVFSKAGTGNGTAIEAKFKDSAWSTVDLPHDWAVELPFVNVNDPSVTAHGYKPVGGRFPETSIGWYRKHFTIPASDSGSRFQLQFDGIYRDANIWVNGFFLGNNKSGYLGAAYDITDFINYNHDNVVVVRVDATQYEGWFYEGAGIYRHVWLNKFNNLHIAYDGIFARTTVNNKQAGINLATTVNNENNSKTGCTITAYCTTRDGKVVGTAKQQTINLDAGGKQIINQQIQVPQPRLWSTDDPYLYRVVVELRSGNTVIEKKVLRLGLRTIEIKTNGVFVNGQHIKLQGVNCHQDHAGVGSALPDYLQYYRIGLLKNMGVNAYRSSHHAPTPELLDACDSLGMLVMDEQRLLNSGAEYMDQFERLIKRDRSRTCVFMWSIGNEEFAIQTSSYGKRIAQTLINKLQQLDPTRTCTYAADLANVFKGVNEVIPVRSFNYRQFAVADYHRDHPSQPLIGTEMGSTVTTRGIYTKDTIRGYVPDQDITAPWWASKAEAWWPLAAVNDYWLGGFVWTGIDYRGEPTPYEWPNINSHFGIMDMCGFPKNIYYYYQSWWTDKDVLHISPHWNWKDKRGQPIDVWVNSNADSVELFLNNKSLGKKQMPRNSHLQWTVNYEPGELKAVAVKKGRSFTTKQITTGAPAEIVCTAYKTTMLADGKDATVVNVHVVDAEGRTVPDADNRIRFAIKGNGKIIGVGNGDPSSHEPDKCANGMWQRNLFNGHCQLIVQAGTDTGNIDIEATAPGLWKGEAGMTLVDPASLSMMTKDDTYTLKGAAAQTRKATNMLGADISFLPELEHRGIRFSDKGVAKDAIEILKDHGFNYVRLRIFNDPARDSGYSPKNGFCDLEHTKQMAARVKKAGMKLLLDFHYSDYWADPGKQYKPAAWCNLSFPELKQALYDYTRTVLLALKAQGTLPDMVQVGNEINHGMVWPEGNIYNFNNLAQLFQAGVAAVKSIDPTIVIMLHVALGGQNDESVFFINNMLARGVHFDVIGQSYYPKWHGTLEDLRDNLTDLATRYNKEVIVVEYSARKEEVNKIAFDLPNGKGKGTCIWEPLNTWEAVFGKDGKANSLLDLYDGIKLEMVGRPESGSEK
jgi:beta-galactosidase